MGMDLVIIVVSYNTRELLAGCLESLYDGLNQSGLDGEVWVVDNASSDGSAAMVKSRFPGVHLVAHEENLGFAAGNNLALHKMGFGSEVKPRHVLFLNPDTRVLGGSLEALMEFLDGAPKAGAAGAGLVYGDGSFQHSAFAFPDLKQMFFDFYPVHHRLLDSSLNGRYARRLYDEGEAFRIDHPLGAALMVRGSTLAEMGGFDERFFMYCEEIDLCRRIDAAGWETYCVPRARIVHFAGQSTDQFRDKMFVALWRSRYLLFEEYESKSFCWAARRLVHMGLGSRNRKAMAAHSRGEIGDEEFERRLRAYVEVRAL
ncbi:glycosyltransferase family 2 protein [Chloroflexota bacterium]